MIVYYVHTNYKRSKESEKSENRTMGEISYQYSVYILLKCHSTQTLHDALVKDRNKKTRNYNEFKIHYLTFYMQHCGQ